MNNRQRQILEAIIKEYQKTGQPVASAILVQKYSFDLSPATIRAEMLALDREGMLEQPHHSAGRVPTTKAHRLFVNQLLSGGESGLKDEEKIRKNLQQLEQERLVPFHLAQFLADFSHNLGLSGSFGQEPDFHEAGLASLLEDIQLSQPESMTEILKGFDILEKEFLELFKKLNKEIEIFIGEENPIDDFRSCSLIISGYELPNQKGFIGILGPKRMNYHRNIFLIEETKKTIEKL